MIEAMAQVHMTEAEVARPERSPLFFRQNAREYSPALDLSCQFLLGHDAILILIRGIEQRAVSPPAFA